MRRRRCARVARVASCYHGSSARGPSGRPNRRNIELAKGLRRQDPGVRVSKTLQWKHGGSTERARLQERYVITWHFLNARAFHEQKRRRARFLLVERAVDSLFGP